MISHATYPALHPGRDALERAIEHLVTLMAAPSTSGQEGPAVTAAEEIASALNLEAERLPVAPGRDNLLIRPRAEGPVDVLLCTHLDTVPPFIPPRRDGDTIHGRGACDAKGVAIAMVHALDLASRVLDRAPRAACLLVVGEETDHIGARAFAAAPPFIPKRVILGEPCGLRPSVGQKGLLKLALRARGVAAHSAYPELGSSAVHLLIKRLAALCALELPRDPILGETTLNVGRIEGGVAANVLAPEATATLLTRCAAPCGPILAAIEATLGPGIEVEVLNCVEPIEFSPLDDASGPAVPFNTDAHQLAPLGAALHLMGPGDMRCAHGPAEHLTVQQLRDGIAAYARALIAFA